MKLKKIKLDGFSMYVDLSLPGISKDLFLAGEREPAFMWMMRKEACGKLGIDFGANIGYTTLNLSKYIDNIIAVEPDKRTRKILKINVKKNNYKDRIKVFSFAVSDKTGHQSLNYAEKSNLTTLCEANDSDKISFSEIIETKTIDDMGVLPDFVKMDIEGYEVEALRGGLETFYRCNNCKILIEVHPNRYNRDRDFAAILKKIVDMGYNFKYVVSAGCACPEAFKKMGYKPFKTFKCGKWSRGIFSDVKSDDAIELCSKSHREYITEASKYTNKVVRYILLVK